VRGQPGRHQLVVDERHGPSTHGLAEGDELRAKGGTEPLDPAVTREANVRGRGTVIADCPRDSVEASASLRQREQLAGAMGARSQPSRNPRPSSR